MNYQYIYKGLKTKTIKCNNPEFLLFDREEGEDYDINEEYELNLSKKDIKKIKKKSYLKDYQSLIIFDENYNIEFILTLEYDINLEFKHGNIYIASCQDGTGYYDSNTKKFKYVSVLDYEKENG